MPKIKGLLATALYVTDLERSEKFFRTVFAFDTIEREANYCAMQVAPQQLLVLKKRGVYQQALALPGGMLPPAEGNGSLHLAFAVSANELDAWLERFAAAGVAIESKISWKKGGARSVYVRDPDDNCIEVMTPGVWNFRN